MEEFIYRTFCPETFVSVNTVVPRRTNTLTGFVILFLTATAEAPPSEEDTITSPVRNLQKKTDLFQLQKVVFCFLFYFRILSEFLSHTTSHHKLATPPCSVDAAGDERVSQSQEAESVRGAAKRNSRVYRRLGEVSHLSASLCCSM